MYILGFGQQTQSSYRNQDISKTEIVTLVQSHHLVNSISRGGDLGKSGPGPRAKADATRTAKKTGGGSLFAQGPINRYLVKKIQISKLIEIKIQVENMIHLRIQT